MTRKVTHEIIINVETGAYTAKPPIDIHQGDSYSHVLLIKLKNDCDKFVSIDGSSRATISFQRNDSIRVSSDAVEIVNPYRGVLSYTLGPAIVNNYGRYTCRLDIKSTNCDFDRAPSVTFVVNVSKSHDYEQGSSGHEVTITEEFYNDLSKHIEGLIESGESVHLSADDRNFLDQFNKQIDELNDLLSTDFDKKIDESVITNASEILSKSFITVDFKSQMTALKRSEVVDGKIVRVNYPMHDNDSGTTETHGIYYPEYYVCKLVGNDEKIEWHQISIEGGDALSEEIFDKINTLEEKYRLLNEKVLRDYGKITSEIDDFRDQINDSLSWRNFDGSLANFPESDSESGEVNG